MVQDVVSKGQGATVQSYIFQFLPFPLVLCGLEHCHAATECLVKAFLFFFALIVHLSCHNSDT